MCTLHLFFQVFPETPVVFAANRDELLDRPWVPPSLLLHEPRILAPRDVLAGGTWVGVNDGGVVAALANHWGTLRDPETTSYCSRGLVVLQALTRRSAREAAAVAQEAAPACKSYTLMLADPDWAFVVERTPQGTSAWRLPPGCHTVTNARFGAPNDRKAQRVRRRMAALAARGVSPSLSDIGQLLADHGVDDPAESPVCIHPAQGSRFGTSSASAVAIAKDRSIDAFWFGGGPPCTTPLEAFPFSAASESGDGDPPLRDLLEAVQAGREARRG